MELSQFTVNSLHSRFTKSEVNIDLINDYIALNNPHLKSKLHVAGVTQWRLVAYNQLS